MGGMIVDNRFQEARFQVTISTPQCVAKALDARRGAWPTRGLSAGGGSTLNRQSAKF